jgi:hypothetical protein
MIRPLLSSDNLLVLVNSLVLSNLNTMAAIWGSADQVNLKILEKVMKSAARLVLNKKWSESVSNDIAEVLHWLMPSSLYKKSLLSLMYKLVHNPYAPEYFRERLNKISEIHRYGTLRL